MKKKQYSYVVLMSFIFATLLHAKINTSILYVSPKPGSEMVSNKTNIIFRCANDIDESTITDKLISIVGSESGVHEGDFLLSDDNKTIVFNSLTAFACDEDVTVSLQPGIKTVTKSEIPAYSFNFETAPDGIVQKHVNVFGDDSNLFKNVHSNSQGALSTASLPAPPIVIDSLNNPSSGYIFMATWDRNVPAKYGNFIFILNSAGEIVDSVRVKGAPFDFQVQPNGLLSYALGDFSINVPRPGEELRHIVLDNSLAVVDSFKMKNGYATDFHEFKMLPNGHVMMMSYHTILFDMSTIVEGGKTDADLVINIIQEQDLNKNVVFEWRNIDYIPITDSDLDLTDSRINYGTLNAFDVDDDGNILASFRNHSEIMKISRTTGEVMWRMGGPRGEFTFVGEHEQNAPYYYARQHNIRRRPNGNITLFDNGQFHKPPYSRAVEYSIDEVNKVATLVSEWRYPNGTIFCVTAGNAELLPDGGWFIGYGVLNPQFVKRNVVEVHPDGSIALEMSLPKGVLAYRAYKFPWKEFVNKPSFMHFEVKEENTYSFNNDSISTGIEITYTTLQSPDYNEAMITRLPYGPIQPQFFDDQISVKPVSILYECFAINSQVAEFHIDLTQYPEIKNPRNTGVFRREYPNQGLFVMLPTSYDSLANKLITTTTGVGEFVFGEADMDFSPQKPIPYEPPDNKKVLPLDSLAIRWTGQGFYDSFQVHISTDSTFNNILIDATLNSSLLYLKELTNHTKYYWRLRSILDSEKSEWSPVWSFETTDAFIILSEPNGGEVWPQETSPVIRWETNILDSVQLDLLLDEQHILSIGKAQGSNCGFRWLIPSDLAVSSSYKIQIVSLEDSSIIDTSDNLFSITGPSGIESISEQLPDNYALLQNYPNPFNPNTAISYQLSAVSNVQLSIFNLNGQLVRTLIDRQQACGQHTVEWNGRDRAGCQVSSGVYLYRLQAGDFIDTKKMILTR